MSAVTSANPAFIERLLNDISPEILSKLVQDHQTAGIVRQFGNVQKTLDIPQFNGVKRLVRGFKKDGSAKGEEFNFDKVQLSVGKFMVVLDVTPAEDIQEAFISHLAASGIIASTLNADVYALQFFTWLLGFSMQYMDAEMEDADWQAITVTTGPNAAEDADMIHKFTGFRRQAATLCAAGNGTVVTTGAIDSTNAVEKVELFYGGFDKQIKKRGGVIFCSFNLFDNYKLRYRSLNSGRELGVETYKDTNYMAAPIYLGGGKTYLVPVQGIGDDDVLIGTLPEYMAIGYNMMGGWDVQKRGFTNYGYLALKYGVTFLMRYAGYLLCNDRLIAVEVTTPRTNA